MYDRVSLAVKKMKIEQIDDDEDGEMEEWVQSDNFRWPRVVQVDVFPRFEQPFSEWGWFKNEHLFIIDAV